MPTTPAAHVTGLFAALCAALVTGCGSSDPAEQNRGVPLLTAPTTTTTTAPRAPARHTDAPAHTSTPTVDPYAGVPLIDHLEWAHNVDGPRLMVYPTHAGRDSIHPGADLRAWQEIRDLDARADTPGMWDQFRCHWEWARLISPEKTSWNLEPWRPPVGYDTTVGAACNPGGPER